MTTYAWPNERAFEPVSADFWLDNTDISVRSVLGGGVQTAGVPGAHWRASIVFPGRLAGEQSALIGFLRSLNGKEHRVALHDLRKKASGGRGYPAGSIATAGVTVLSTAAQLASTVTFTGCGANATLQPGDMWGAGGQLVENPTLATANGSGVMTVSVPQRLRSALAATTPVTLIKPTALFVLSEPFRAPFRAGMYESFAIDLEEVFQ